MKKHVTASFVLLFMAFNCRAQSDCSIKETIDEFTKSKIRETKLFTVASGLSQNVNFQLSKVDSDFHLTIRYEVLGFSPLVIEKGSELMLKLTNDSILTVYALETSVAGSKGGGGKTTQLFGRYTVTSEQLSILGNVPSTKLRFITTSGYIEKEFTAPGTDRLLKNARCMLK
jgi:hypothetical protein